MKKLIFLWFIFIGGRVAAQKIPEYGVNKVHIIDSGRMVQAELHPYHSEPKAKPHKFYYWYLDNAIHHSEGGFSGRLLNGQYLEFYPDNNLKEQGGFKKGLKSGTWKSWKDDGDLVKTTKWKDGTLLPDSVPPLWKRLHFFKKKGLKAMPAKRDSVR